MKVTIDKKAKTVTIVLDLLETPRLSSTGATINIAEARNQFAGFKQEVDGKDRDVKVTAQVYVKPDKAA